jgi:Xaa-Pro aminopeptidase
LIGAIYRRVSADAIVWVANRRNLFWRQPAVLTQGMTFSCEPGIYDPDWGGFRHSDTVVVGKNNGEVLNRYPTRLDDMIY